MKQLETATQQNILKNKTESMYYYDDNKKKIYIEYKDLDSFCGEIAKVFSNGKTIFYKKKRITNIYKFFEIIQNDLLELNKSYYKEKLNYIKKSENKESDKKFFTKKDFDSYKKLINYINNMSDGENILYYKRERVFSHNENERHFRYEPIPISTIKDLNRILCTYDSFQVFYIFEQNIYIHYLNSLIDSGIAVNSVIDNFVKGCLQQKKKLSEIQDIILALAEELADKKESVIKQDVEKLVNIVNSFVKICLEKGKTLSNIKDDFIKKLLNKKDVDLISGFFQICFRQGQNIPDIENTIKELIIDEYYSEDIINGFVQGCLKCGQKVSHVEDIIKSLIDKDKEPYYNDDIISGFVQGCLACDIDIEDIKNIILKIVKNNIKNPKNIVAIVGGFAEACCTHRKYYTYKDTVLDTILEIVQTSPDNNMFNIIDSFDINYRFFDLEDIVSKLIEKNPGNTINIISNLTKGYLKRNGKHTIQNVVVELIKKNPGNIADIIDGFIQGCSEKRKKINKVIDSFVRSYLQQCKNILDIQNFIIEISKKENIGINVIYNIIDVYCTDNKVQIDSEDFKQLIKVINNSQNQKKEESQRILCGMYISNYLLMINKDQMNKYKIEIPQEFIDLLNEVLKRQGVNKITNIEDLTVKEIKILFDFNQTKEGIDSNNVKAEPLLQIITSLPESCEVGENTTLGELFDKQKETIEKAQIDDINKIGKEIEDHEKQIKQKKLNKLEEKEEYLKEFLEVTKSKIGENYDYYVKKSEEIEQKINKIQQEKEELKKSNKFNFFDTILKEYKIYLQKQLEIRNKDQNIKKKLEELNNLPNNNESKKEFIILKIDKKDLEWVFDKENKEKYIKRLKDEKIRIGMAMMLSNEYADEYDNIKQEIEQKNNEIKMYNTIIKIKKKQDYINEIQKEEENYKNKLNKKKQDYINEIQKEEENYKNKLNKKKESEKFEKEKLEEELKEKKISIKEFNERYDEYKKCKKKLLNKHVGIYLKKAYKKRKLQTPNFGTKEQITNFKYYKNTRHQNDVVFSFEMLITKDKSVSFKFIFKNKDIKTIDEEFIKQFAEEIKTQGLEKYYSTHEKECEIKVKTEGLNTHINLRNSNQKNNIYKMMKGSVNIHQGLGQ